MKTQTPPRFEVDEKVAKAGDLIKKWLPHFGFGDFDITVNALPPERCAIDGSADDCVWAESSFHLSERWAEFWFVPDPMLPAPEREHLVLHELTHGLIQHARTGDHAIEDICDVVPQLVLGRRRTPNRYAAKKWPDKFYTRA